ncbi:MRE11 double-strand break endo/exonuclease [Arthrobacter phage DrYang]|uniref:MRE11 double-strand break endo/exonuclease n=1 Tax=Arthrobacter phage DrYang TaxID=2686080 RepID=A0A6B9JBY4_9CAUD|nr:MRE11 double-strand break endo/exonuclease [Arthrobacter phage DrYang]QGZ17143.1 MRE11 double-strand break endo/exonuclease [Arthrobacter phage DrYang]
MIPRGAEVVRKSNHQLGKVLGYVPGGYEVMWNGTKAISYEDETTIEPRFEEDSEEPMKVIALQAENVKRLRAVSIGFDGTLQVIGGDNGEGKSSVLDAIWLALGGRQAVSETQTTRPIHDGEAVATATVDLGELIVTRTWKEGKSPTVKVTTPEGAEHKSPQAILDALTAKVGIDPLAFTQVSAKEQIKQLLALVDLPFDPAELDAEYAELFAARTTANRRVAEVEARLKSYPEPAENLPEQEVDVAELVDTLRRIDSINAAVTRANERLTEAAASVQYFEEKLEAAKAEQKAAQVAQADAYNLAKASPNAEEVRAKLDTVSETNKAVRTEQERQRGIAALAQARAASDGLSRKLKAIQDTKTKGLAAAEWPIEGLGFDAEGLTFNGVPFSQASSAEQIRVSMAMAMAAAPKLKTLFIRDGSLLDRKNMALVAELAAARGYQVIMERVGDHDPGAVIIEDGTVKVDTKK